MSHRRNTPLGRRQQLVLMLLAENSKSVEDMVYDHFPGLGESAIRSAISSLERRGMVDVFTVEPSGRTGRMVRSYSLTRRGHEALNTIVTDDEGVRPLRAALDEEKRT
jgi:predicted ArsR family transcriptional regulator